MNWTSFRKRTSHRLKYIQQESINTRDNTKMNNFWCGKRNYASTYCCSVLFNWHALWKRDNAPARLFSRVCMRWSLWGELIVIYPSTYLFEGEYFFTCVHTVTNIWTFVCMCMIVICLCRTGLSPPPKKVNIELYSYAFDGIVHLVIFCFVFLIVHFISVNLSMWSV